MEHWEIGEQPISQPTQQSIISRRMKGKASRSLAAQAELCCPELWWNKVVMFRSKYLISHISQPTPIFCSKPINSFYSLLISTPCKFQNKNCLMFFYKVIWLLILGCKFILHTSLCAYPRTLGSKGIWPTYTNNYMCSTTQIWADMELFFFSRKILDQN